MLKRQTYLVVLLLAVLFSACSNFFQKIGEDVSSGIDAEALTASVVATLNEDSTKTQLAAIVDRLITSSDTSINELLTQLEIDTLSKEVFQSFTTQLSESGLTDTLEVVLNKLAVNLTTNLTDTVLSQLNSEQTTKQLQAFKASLLDDETTALVSKSLQQIIVDLPLQSIADQMRNDLLGEDTKLALAGMVDTSMSIVVSRLDSDISPVIDVKLDFIQRYAKELLLVIGLLALGIIAFVWWQRRKYHKLVGLLAGKIDEIPDQHVYDRLTTDIRSRAVEEGLEPTLKDVLNEYGLTASEAWKKRQIDN